MSEFSRRVAEHQNLFTNSQRTIASYLSEHLDVAAFRSLNDLAQKIGVSTTSVIRFSRVLGYQGFSEMQKSIQSDYHLSSSTKRSLPNRIETMSSIPDNKLLADSFHNDIINIQQTLAAQKSENLSQAVELISNARSVYILGLRTSFSSAYYMASRLGEIRNNVRLIQSSGLLYPEEIVDGGPDDVCIAYMFPRYSKISSTIISWLKNSGCKIILFTSLNYQAVSGYGDIILPCAISSLSYKNSFAAPLCLSNYLVSALVRKNPAEAQEVLQKTEAILNQGFYLGL